MVTVCYLVSVSKGRRPILFWGNLIYSFLSWLVLLISFFHVIGLVVSLATWLLMFLSFSVSLFFLSCLLLPPPGAGVCFSGRGAVCDSEKRAKKGNSKFSHLQSSTQSRATFFFPPFPLQGVRSCISNL